MSRLLLSVLLAAILMVACASDASPAHLKPCRGKHCRDDSKSRCNAGTTERPVRQIKLASGEIFCLQLPRFLKNPQADVIGNKYFVRTYDDTCGLYGIVFSSFVPAGGGPPPHIHHADEEWFLPHGEGQVVRVHAQKAGAPLRTYKPGQVPGFNVDPVAVGGVEVPTGEIGYSPPNTPHTWKAVTNMTNFMAIWGYGFAMIPGVNLPEDPTASNQAVLEKTGLWGLPTDMSGNMFMPADNKFTTEARGPIAIPAVDRANLQHLQKLLDGGEACYPPGGIRPEN